MKNKFLVLVLIFALVALLAFAGCDTTTAPADDETPQSWTLDFATFWPAVDFQVADGHKAWAKEISDRVAEETIHEINFVWHYQGQLLGMQELYTGVSDGSADVATTCPAYTPGVFPVTEAFELPGYNNDNALVASVTMNEAYKISELLQEEYKDAKVMFFWATGPGDFITNTPVRKMEDLAGLPIRAVGGTIPWVAALGAEPVSLGMGAAYENLETGVVDGLLAPTDVLKGFRLAEVTQYITKSPPTYNIIFMKVMNWDTWNAFPASVQQIIEEVNEKYVIEYGKLRTDHTVIGQQFAVDAGHEVIELASDEYQRWVDLIDPIMEQWILKADGLGYSGQEIVDMVREFDERYSAIHGNYGK